MLAVYYYLLTSMTDFLAQEGVSCPHKTSTSKRKIHRLESDHDSYADLAQIWSRSSSGSKPRSAFKRYTVL